MNLAICLMAGQTEFFTSGSQLIQEKGNSLSPAEGHTVEPFIMEFTIARGTVLWTL